MEIIRAILSIFLGLLFLSFVIKLTYPLLILAGLFIFYTVIRIAIANNKYKRQSNNQRQNTGRSSTTTSSSNPNIIDAEYTEEEID